MSSSVQKGEQKKLFLKIGFILLPVEIWIGMVRKADRQPAMWMQPEAKYPK